MKKALLPVAISAAVLISSIGLSACGSSKKRSAHKTTKASQLNSLRQSAKSAKNATFQATWTSTTNGTTTTLTLGQEPPKSFFKVGAGTIIDDGTHTYYCANKLICLKESGANPLSTLFDLYNGTTFINEVQAWSSQGALSAAGVSLSFSNATYAGVASRCVTITHNATSEVWCVAKNSGLLTYWYAANTYFTLTAYSSTPPAAEFSLPKGATVTSL